MFLIKQILILLFALLTEINSLQNVATKTTFPTIVLNSNSNSSIKQKVRKKMNHNDTFIFNRLQMQILL
jgi:hypothetical protein